MGIRVSRWLLGSVVLLAAFLLALPRGELFAQDAPLTLQPASGPPGTSVSIEGAFLKCLSRSTEFQILWDGGQRVG